MNNIRETKLGEKVSRMLDSVRSSHIDHVRAVEAYINEEDLNDEINRLRLAVWLAEVSHYAIEHRTDMSTDDIASFICSLKTA